MCHDHCPHPVRGGDAVTEDEIRIPLVSGELPAFIAIPDPKPAPAVLVMHDINGVNDFYRDVTRRLALAGYLAVLPDLFHREGPPADDSREAKQARMRSMQQSNTLTDIQSALLWLQRHPQATGKLGTVGFCMGGTYVMLAASRDPAPDASVAFYGFPRRERTPTNPILPSDADEVINLKSPLLALWGTEDAGVGMDNVDQYEQQLDQFHKDHEFVRYPGIGHGFLTFEPGKPATTPSQDAWDHMLRLFAERLTHTEAS
jgi:carboxymethylenebutenolidase